jgi:threonylcarbamoyladenosine tRNA methylthiotransferase MtaB
MDRLRVAIVTVGCRVNQADAAWLGRALDPAEIEVVEPGRRADAIVINSCAVTQAAERDVRRVLSAARASSGPDVKVLFTGCMATACPEHVAELGSLWLVVPSAERERIPAQLSSLAAASRGAADETRRGHHSVPRPLRRVRPLLRVQDGCEQGCTYCAVPAGRGRERSLEERDVIERLRRLAAEGAREVVICGVNLGAWGIDLTPRRRLADLLRLLEAEAPVDRLRLGSIEPWALDAAAVEVLAGARRLAPHLHLPVQSGDDVVLRRMGRPHSEAQFRGLVSKLLEARPDLALGTDVIAGFPGEDESAFSRTVGLVNELSLAVVHAFGFSPRPGTRAAALGGRVPQPEIDSRVARLRAAGRDARALFANTLAGRTLEVLIQGRSPSSEMLWGLSGQFVRVKVDGLDSLMNHFVSVRVQSTADDGYLVGEVLRVD